MKIQLYCHDPAPVHEFTVSSQSKWRAVRQRIDHELRKEVMLKPSKFAKGIGRGEKAMDAEMFDFLYKKNGIFLAEATKPADEDTLMQVRQLEWSYHYF